MALPEDEEVEGEEGAEGEETAEGAESTEGTESKGSDAETPKDESKES